MLLSVYLLTLFKIASPNLLGICLIIIGIIIIIFKSKLAELEVKENRMFPWYFGGKYLKEYKGNEKSHDLGVLLIGILVIIVGLFMDFFKYIQNFIS